MSTSYIHIWGHIIHKFQGRAQRCFLFENIIQALAMSLYIIICPRWRCSRLKLYRWTRSNLISHIIIFRRLTYSAVISLDDLLTEAMFATACIYYTVDLTQVDEGMSGGRDGYIIHNMKRVITVRGIDFNLKYLNNFRVWSCNITFRVDGTLREVREGRDR